MTPQLIPTEEAIFLIESRMVQHGMEVGVMGCLDFSGPQFTHLQSGVNAIFRVNVLGTEN